MPKTATCIASHCEIWAYAEEMLLGSPQTHDYLPGWQHRFLIPSPLFLVDHNWPTASHKLAPSFGDTHHSEWQMVAPTNRGPTREPKEWPRVHSSLHAAPHSYLLDNKPLSNTHPTFGDTHHFKSTNPKWWHPPNKARRTKWTQRTAYSCVHFRAFLEIEFSFYGCHQFRSPSDAFSLRPRLRRDEQ